MTDLFRRFLEWIYLFDFIDGHFADTLFYYLHPESFVKEIEEITLAQDHVCHHGKCPKCGRELICNSSSCDHKTEVNQ